VIAIAVSLVMMTGLSTLMVYGIERMWRRRGLPHTRHLCQFRIAAGGSQTSHNYRIKRAA
jgi:hypothetical protein